MVPVLGGQNLIVAVAVQGSGARYLSFTTSALLTFNWVYIIYLAIRAAVQGILL